MKGYFLTQVFNPYFIFISYFNRNINTLKQFLLLTTAVFSAFAVSAQSYNNIEFIENKGQWDSRVLYKGDVSNGAFYIRNGGFTVVQHNPVEFAAVGKFLHGQNADGFPVTPNQTYTLHSHAYHVDFLNASADIKSVPSKVIQTYNNYFIGNDQTKWGRDCKIFQAVTLENVYPNVDVRYYTDNDFLKYDIIVKPGGDVSKIALKYNGVNKVQEKNKELVMSTSVGELKESRPYTYQADRSGKSGRKEINCKYVVKDDVVTFDVKNYDRSATLIIDPQVIFCSFSGSTADNWGFTATYGADGSMYGGGIVFNGGNFPVSPGAFQTVYGGGNTNGTGPIDIGIIKLSPNGASRIYATYIGGSDNEQPHSLIVDNQGNLVIAGRSSSANYPVTNNGTLAGSGFDIVVTKLNATGTALIGSKKIGGSGDDGVNISATRGLSSLQRNYGDDGRSEVILDGGGNVYVASCTRSPGSGNPLVGAFPVTAGAFQTAFGGGSQDGVVLKLTPDLSNLTFASFLGGSGNDAAYVLSLGPGGDIYVAGGTESSNLPGNTAGTVGTANNGNVDGFISIISNNGATVNRTAYIGTGAFDQVFGIQFDNKGFPYIMGQTTGNWTVRNAAYSNAGGKQFIAKLQPDLSAFVYSTAFGSSGAPTPNISPIAFLVDRCENVYISGWGGSIGTNNEFQSSGTTGLPVTPDAIKTNTDGKDIYFFVLQKDATSLLFASFFGENNTPPNQGCDHVDGGTSRFDRNGTIYQAICGNCSLGSRPVYPVTTGAWSTVNNASGAGCNLTMVKIAMNLAGVAGGVQSAIDGSKDTAGCLPLPVIFTDTIANAQSYEWHFNYVPGNPPDLITTTPNASFTYTAVGVYRVMLVAVDLNTCNQRDSSFINIRVGDLRADLRPFWQPIGPGCPKFTYEFINNSVTDPSRPFQDTSFVWDFGDGSPRVPARIGAANSVTHTYPGFGTYLPKLILKDTSYCNNPDDSTFRISIADNVKAIIETPATGCVEYNAVFRNRSLNGDSFVWDFGDPSSPNNTSTLENPTHLYVNAGTYIVRLTANNAGTCNLTHDTTFTVTVFDAPIPDFSFAPIPPLENTPTTFTNLSSPDAVRFKWTFGDGDSIITASRAPVTHQYNATGIFNACLTAYNAAGCDSIICKPVEALINPLVDVPNAFTPQSGDVNSVVLVRGFGIAKMQFIIWNRWGQKVFETNNRNQGWDGKVKGVVQPMDVYVYTLSVEFFDGVKTTKKGDITLIR